MLAITLLTTVCIIAFTFEIIFGLAGTIIMISIMTYVYDTKTLVIYAALPQVLAGSIALFRSPKTIEAQFFICMLMYASFGAMFGLAIFYYLPGAVFHKMLATLVTAIGLYLVFSPKIIKLNNTVTRLLDVFAGVTHSLFGISGPIVMARLVSTFDDKTLIRNYALAFFLSLNVFRVGGYLATGTFTPDILQMMYISAPFIAIALWFSNHLHYKVNDVLFKKVISWVILIGGVSMLVK